jgi:hypothetical protein
MVLAEATGVMAVAVGIYSIARPMSIRSFQSAKEWTADPESAAEEQRAWATMMGVSFIAGGLILIALGLLGSMP